MFDRILLPLDGSNLAEEAIPYGEELARKLGSEVILLHVCPPDHKLAHNMHRLYLEKMAELIQERLNKALPKGKEAKVRAEHPLGNFAEEIRDCMDKNDIGLVIMTAHGASSLRVRILGSRVDKIFRLVSCPTLLIRTVDIGRKKKDRELIGRILLPLDGSENSELALPVAQELALKLKAKLNLFRMAQKAHYTPSKDDMVGDMGLDDEEVSAAELERAQAYLKGIEEKLKQQGVDTSSSVALGDDPAKEITAAGREADADLKVMATRGRSPITAWAPGSIAHQLLNAGDLPLLIVRKAV